MSNGDMTMINDEILYGSENHVNDNEVYKNLRRRSALLPFILIIFLPALLLFFNIACTPQRSIAESLRQISAMLVVDLDCLAIVLGWLLIQSVFFFLPNRCNGILAFIGSLSGVYILNWLNIIQASYIYDNISKILIASIIVSISIAFLLFLKGIEGRRLKQINPIISFFYGTDINLTFVDIDLKLFLEFRVGLIGWACLNLCFLLKTMELYTYRRPPFILLIVIQQILQALQLIWYEEDRIINDNIRKETIGFIRVFGSFCWFPFLWCLPSQYLTLVNYPIKRLYIILSVTFSIIGMFIYRSAHNQQEMLKKSKKNIKSMFLNDELISLTSSYWSLCRHPYYLGNLLMLISWALPCGSTSIPWMLPTYYLLVICHKSHLEDLISD